MIKKRFIIAGMAVVLIIVGSGAYLYNKTLRMPVVPPISTEVTKSSVLPTQATTSEAAALHSRGNYASETNMSAPITIRVVRQPIYEYDYSIGKYLMGASHNVFVAKIIKQVGSKLRDGLPYTQFEAEVILNIKGNPSGVVTINEEGGFLNGILYVPYKELLAPANVPGVGHLLAPGDTYLLATRNGFADWLTVISFPSVIKLVSENSFLSNAQLQSLAVNDPRVRELQAAYPNEVLATADVYNHTTFSSYQSLTEAQKYALPFYRGSYNPNPPAPTSTPTSTSR